MSREILDDGVRIDVLSANDPFFVYSGLKINADEQNVLILTAKATGNNTSLSVYFNVNQSGDFNESRRLSIALINDGE